MMHGMRARRGVPRTLGVLALVLAASGCGDGGSQSAPTTSTAVPGATTTSEPTTTTTGPPSASEQVSALTPFDSTVAQYIDLLSAGIPIYLDGATGSGVPTSDVGGAFGGDVAPGVEVFALGGSLSDDVRGGVVIVDTNRTDGTIPTQFVSTALGFLDPSTSEVVDLFRLDVVPALTTISEDSQRFSLGGVTLQLDVVGPAAVAFTVIASGQEVPEFIGAL
jgi:hypothetical protein